MPQFDRYEKVRPPLNEHVQGSIDTYERDFRGRIESTKAKHPDWDPAANKVLGGVKGPDGDLIANVAVAMSIEAAKEQAVEQLEVLDWPMPEDEEITLRFPGTSPKGKYCIIDMKLAQRLNNIDANARFCSPELKQYIDNILNSPLYKGLEDRIKDISNKHRLLTRASKLCIYEDGRQWLHEQARNLETNPDVIEMDQVMQGIEYLCGMRDTVTPDVANLFQNEMKLPLNQQLRQQLNPEPTVPDTLEIQFENFNDILTQRAFSGPHNWGKPAEDLIVYGHTATEAASTVQPYAIATAKQALKPAIAHIEKCGFDFRDMLIVDGKSIQEHIEERGITDKAAVENWAAALVASALISGKRVEAFLPGKDGKLPAQPTAITKKGYAPERSEPVVLNTWERFCAKLGFYKEKVAQAEEYKRAMAARERVVPNIEKRAAQKLQSRTADTHKMFFGGLENELSEIPTNINGTPSPFRNVTRTSPTSICICALAIDYPLADIMDPSKLQAEKQAMARKYIQEAKSGSIIWLGNVLAAGTFALEQKLDNLAFQTDFKDPVQRAQVLPVLCAAAYAGFDIYQDVTARDNDALLSYYSENRIEWEQEAARAQGNRFVVDSEDHISYGKNCLDKLQAAYTLCNAMEKGTIARAALQKPELSEHDAKKALADMVVGDLATKELNKDKYLHECAFHAGLQDLFAIELYQNGEIGKVAKAIAENPNARTAMAKLAAAMPMNEVLQVNTPKVLTDPEAHNAPKIAAKRITNETKVALSEHLTPVLGKNPVQAGKVK